MNFIIPSLFLGFLVDEAFTRALEKNTPEYLHFFLQPGSGYLEEVTYQEERYIGKFVSNEQNVGQLELLEAHIFSLLKKLAPDYNYTHSNLVLFALPQKEVAPAVISYKNKKRKA